MTSRSTSVLTIAGLTVVGGVLAYALYFDYKRRNDTEFRKRLSKCWLVQSLRVRTDQHTPGKEKKRVDKTLAQSKESLLSASGLADVTPAALKQALEEVKNEPAPESPEEKEAYFMNQVSQGEALSIRGTTLLFVNHCATSDENRS